MRLDADYFMCVTYPGHSPEHVNRFERTFEGVYRSLLAIVRDMYRFSIFVPCRNIFLMEHIWRDKEILVTGF